MGCAFSKGGEPAKDKNDKYIDEIDYEALKVPSIDEAMEPAFDMLSTAIAVNNTLWQTVDTLKLVAATLMGAMVTELEVNGTSVKYLVQKVDDDGVKTTVAELSGSDPVIKSEADYKKMSAAPSALSAVEACTEALAKLNKALVPAEGSDLMTSTVKTGPKPGSRVGIASTEGVAAKEITSAKSAIKGFNNTFFVVKAELIQMGLQGGLAKAIAEVIANVKKLVSGIKPTCEIDFAKLMEGELDIKPDLGVSVSDISKVAPKKVKACLDAIFGEGFLKTGDPMSKGGLIFALVDTCKQCAELLSKFNESKEAIQALTSNPADLISKTKEAGIDGMAAMKIPGKVAANVKTVMKTPLILADLTSTLKTVAGEVKAGLLDEVDVAP